MNTPYYIVQCKELSYNEYENVHKKKVYSEKLTILLWLVFV